MGVANCETVVDFCLGRAKPAESPAETGGGRPEPVGAGRGLVGTGRDWSELVGDWSGPGRGLVGTGRGWSELVGGWSGAGRGLVGTGRDWPELVGDWSELVRTGRGWSKPGKGGRRARPGESGRKAKEMGPKHSWAAVRLGHSMHRIAEPCNCRTAHSACADSLAKASWACAET